MMSDIFIDKAINKILFNLSTIGKYKKGDVLDTSADYMNIVDASWAESIKRTFSGDSRQRALTRFRHEIETAYEYAERILESKHLMLYQTTGTYDFNITIDALDMYTKRRNMLGKILEGINGVIPGLTNFCEDKGDDLPTKGDCEQLIGEVSNYWRKLNGFISVLDEHKNNFSMAKDGLVEVNSGFN